MDVEKEEKGVRRIKLRVGEVNRLLQKAKCQELPRWSPKGNIYRNDGIWSQRKSPLTVATGTLNLLSLGSPTCKRETIMATL